jgi:Raf kinase inhibitor-like YbhB/YbcL family protein
MTMLLDSKAFRHGEPIPAKHTCEGANVPPPLRWTGVPSETRSFVITCFDPDAPRAEGWAHWGVYDLPGHLRAFDPAEGLPPAARTVAHDGGKPGWSGPCPPVGHGAHRYRFRIFALPVATLQPPPEDWRALSAAAEKQALATAEIVGVYERRARPEAR